MTINPGPGGVLLDEQGREIRSACAWCDAGKARHEELTRQGYAVSSSICPLCLVKVRAAQVPQAVTR